MNHEDPLTILALSAGRGERAALDQFIRATERDVWRTVAFLADPGSADDLTQETYLRVIGALPRSVAVPVASRTRTSV